MRQPYQISVIPFFKDKDSTYLYAAFLCKGEVYWAPVTGGGEEGETHLETAIRETFEESGILETSDKYIRLDTTCAIPRDWIGQYSWEKDVFVIPEYCFAVAVKSRDIVLSDEHSFVEWLPFEAAFKRYRYEAHKIALWELNQRLTAQTTDF